MKDHQNLSVTIVLKEEFSGFSVQCVDLPGCISQGDSREEAISNIQEVITGYLEVFSDEKECISTKKEVLTVDL